MDPSQIRAHAENVAMVRDKFAAVKSASAQIVQNDQAYGMLCSWMPLILEGRHTRQNEPVAFVEENLAIMTQNLNKTAEAYEAIDADHDKRMRQFLIGSGNDRVATVAPVQSTRQPWTGASLFDSGQGLVDSIKSRESDRSGPGSGPGSRSRRCRRSSTRSARCSPTAWAGRWSTSNRCGRRWTR